MAAVPEIPAIPLTITGVFNSAMEFDQLLNRIGINVRCRNRLIVDKGISTAQDMSETRPKDLKSSLENINKLFGSKPVPQMIYFTPRLMLKLVSICVYLRCCIMRHRVPDICRIDNFSVQEFVSKLEEWDKEEGTTVNSLIKISFDQRNLTTFNDKLLTLLSSTYGCRNCTLEYIIRDNETPLFGLLMEEISPDVSSPNILSDRVTLFDSDYQADNKALFSILRTYLTDTAGWNLISSFSQAQNGRAAYKALCSHYQGSTYVDFLKTKANTMMTTTFYCGEFRQFDFNKYIDIHL